MTDQPEELRLAQKLENRALMGVGDWFAAELDAARLLREQHKEIARLREAVTKYGRHLNDCVGMLGGYQCTCGFNQQGSKP